MKTTVQVKDPGTGNGRSVIYIVVKILGVSKEFHFEFKGNFLRVYLQSIFYDV